MMMMDHHDNQS